MTSAFDVAAYIVDRNGPQDAFSLQKLLYYSQGWCLAETGESCFSEPIEAWRNGPVVRSVWEGYRSHEAVALGDAARLNPTHREIIDDVLVVYGQRRANELIEATHAEPGWLVARRGLSPGDRGQTPIDLGLVVDYLRGSPGSDRLERMTAALDRSRERAQFRKVIEPHRSTMMRLAQ